MASETPLNPFEVFFDQVDSPEKREEFDRWVVRHTFFVPAELQGGGGIRLKAFQHQGQNLIPFFSAEPRFQKWSTPDPTGKFARLDGRAFFAMIPFGAAAIMNPGSDRFSKWFTPEEIRAVLALPEVSK